ncbi:hypothetical protein V2J09_018688 [Rumex salicifolius]
MKAYKDGNGSSGRSLHSARSCWMSRWTNAPSNQGSLVAPHSQTFSRDEVFDHTQKSLRTNLGIPSDISRSYGVIRNNTKAKTSGLDMGNLTLRAPFCRLGDFRNRENTWTTTPLDPSCVPVANNSSALKSNPSSPTHIFATRERDGNFTNHCSNNDFISLNQESRKREKYSAILVHEKSAFSPLLSDNQFEGMQIDCQADAPMRNVEAMRICNAVDSIEKSHGSLPFYSKTTTTHHVLFSRQTANESTQHRGVKIQPLWSSTDSEKDNFGDAETPRYERSFDMSAETDTMDLFPLPNQNNPSGMLFPPIAKPQSTTATDMTFLMACVDPWEDKFRGKLPVTVTETPSTSRTQSMETDHLLSCAEQLSESKTFQHIDECALEERSCNRSVKRLKLSSSSSHDKTHVLLNMMMEEHSKEIPNTTSKEKIQRKEPSRNVVPIMMKGESSSSTTKKNPIFQSSWIQRWCQDGSVKQERDPSKSVVVCGPDRSKTGLDELDKKRFPSIAAVAMMGKSVDGFHACKYTKRGPLVVWNSKDY